LFRAGKYQESLEKTKAMDAGDCKTFVMLPVLYAFNYDRLGDSLQAKTYLEKFFAIAPLDKIEPIHYELAVKVFSKFPGSEMVAASYLQKAIENDTTKANKLSYMKQAADMFGKAKMYGEQVKWLTKYNDLKGTMGEYDHYLITSSAYSGMDYVATMTYAQKYIVAFSEKPQGYVFNVKAAKALDTTTTPGILVEALLFNNKYLSLDTVKNNKTIASNYYTIMIHYADRMKDYVTALEYCNKFLAIYPADPEMLGIKKTLETMVNKIKTPAKSASGAKATTTTDGSTPK
jgi:tetratricopeptide (TPR) repeat protein